MFGAGEWRRGIRHFNEAGQRCIADVWLEDGYAKELRITRVLGENEDWPNRNTVQNQPNQKSEPPRTLDAGELLDKPNLNPAELGILKAGIVAALKNMGQ